MRRPAWLLCLSLALLLVGGCSRFGTHSSTTGYTESGKASYYASQHQGRRTASGERFDQAKLTAAHRTLPFGTQVRVVHARTGKSVVVRINDRGPFVRGRIIDLSGAAFRQIGELRSGVIPVRLEVLR